MYVSWKYAYFGAWDSDRVLKFVFMFHANFFNPPTINNECSFYPLSSKVRYNNTNNWYQMISQQFVNFLVIT